MKIGWSRFLKLSRFDEARSENMMTSFGCLLSSSFIMDSSNPLTILIENFLSKR